MRPLSITMSCKISGLFFFLILLGSQPPAKADDTLVDPGQITFREAIGDTGNEYIDPYTGHLDLAYADLHLPGNGGLDLRIIRTYKSSRVTDTATVDSKLGYGWDIHFGKVKKDGNYATIELQDGTINTAVRKTIGSEDYITKDFWKLHAPLTGYPSLQLTDGRQITFGRQSLINLGYFMATEIRKNNNSIGITYVTGSDNISQLTYKAGSSTKTIQFGYALTGKKHLKTISWGSPARQISYSYNSDDLAVASVQLPGGDTWKYTYQSQNLNLRNAYILKTLTTPWGGSVSYAFDTFYKSCGIGAKTQGSLASKTVSGRGLDTGTWSYNYTVANGYDKTVVNDTCGRTTTHTFHGHGSSYNYSCYTYGLPVSKTVMSGTTQEESTSYQWSKLPTQLSPVADSVYCVCSDNATYVPVKTAETYTRGGKTYTTTYGSFDTYGSPQQITEQGSDGKTQNLLYWYDVTRNMVKDKPSSITTSGSANFPGTFTTNYTYHTSAAYYGEVKSLERNGVKTEYVYDSNSNLSSSKDANNHTTSYLWEHGTVSRITTPYYVISRSLNWDGTVGSETNGRNETTSYLYDEAMRPTRITPPVGNPTITSYTYSGGYLTSKSEQCGSFATSRNYDGLGREISTSNSLGITTGTSYHPCGIKKQTSSNISDTTLFDHFGRPTLITHLDGSTRGYKHIDDSHLQITDEEGYVTHHYYRYFGSPDERYLYRIIDADNQTTDYAYNILGSLRQASGVGRTDSYEYSTKNFLTSATHPESGTTIYTQDNVGNLKTIQDSLGTRTFVYDDINRLKSVTSSAGGTLSYAYDNANNLISAQSPYSSATHDYDASNRLRSTQTTLRGITGTVAYHYDGNDNLTSITYPDSTTVNYAYNGLNQATSVTGFGGDIHNIAYYTSGPELGLLRQYIRSNGQMVSFAYDNRRRPAGSTYPETQLGYAFNVRGNLKNLYNYQARAKDASFDYDKLNRLTSFNGPWGLGQYQYNSSGDRIQKKIGSTSSSYAYTNHLLSGSNYAFNGDGDMTQYGETTFEYDGFHHMTKASRSGTVLATYGYDGGKQRIYKIAGDATTLYFRDAKGNTLSELTGVGVPLDNFIYLGDRLIAKVSYNRLGDVLRDGTRDLRDAILGLQVVSGSTPTNTLFLAADVSGSNTIGLDETIYDLGVAAGINPSSEKELFFYDTDYLGTPRTLCNASGDAVWQADEMPFGEEYAEGGIVGINSRRYIGKEKDKESGLLYIGARFMAAPDGRFGSADPVGLVNIETGEVNKDILGDPQRLNRYAYGLNNPYRYVDPDGRNAVLTVDPDAASGYGHTTLYFQNKEGKWHSYNQGAASQASSGGNMGFLMGLNAPAGVSIEPVEKPPNNGYTIETTSAQDEKINKSALQSAESHNSGKVKYNLYRNNCTDAAVDVINKSSADISVKNSPLTVKPNSWIKELKKDKK